MEASLVLYRNKFCYGPRRFLNTFLRCRIAQLSASTTEVVYSSPIPLLLLYGLWGGIISSLTFFQRALLAASTNAKDGCFCIDKRTTSLFPLDHTFEPHSLHRRCECTSYGAVRVAMSVIHFLLWLLLASKHTPPFSSTHLQLPTVSLYLGRFLLKIRQSR
jgi:hypothetical protein